MFFPRLRRHAKWMFVFLAVALGGGFVIFGVGAGGTGVGDIFRGNGGTSGVPSISKAREQTEKTPKNAEAWRDLSTALQTNGQTDEAIAALSQYHGAEAQRTPTGFASSQASTWLRGVSSSATPSYSSTRQRMHLPGRTFPVCSRSPAGRSWTTRSRP